MRILGVAFVMYVLSFIDRTNIAMAIPAMRAELHLSAVAIGEATSVFFWGYIVLQIPAGRLAGVWSAKRIIFLQLLAWAAISMTTAFVHTGAELWIMAVPLRERFRGAHISLDIMTTAPAVRTYNVMLMESRRVGAGLIAL